MASDGSAGDGRNRRRDGPAQGGGAATFRSSGAEARARHRQYEGNASSMFISVRMEERSSALPEHLTHCLRALYDDVLDEPVPERFRRLLDQLDRKAGDTDAAE